MSDFESRRLQNFARVANDCLPRFNLSTGMMPGPRQTITVAAQKRQMGMHNLVADGDMRSTAQVALAFAMSGMEEPAWQALSTVLDYQDLNPRSLTYGNFFWYTNWKAEFGLCRDPNAESFIVPMLCFLLQHRGERLPATLRQRTLEALALTMTGLNAHRATWGYTNIALLNMASKLMISEVLSDPRAEKLACWDWEEWRNHTARFGMITEYNSVCYTTVQIEALAMMLSCTNANPVLLGEVRSVMRHLITAAVLDYHPGVGRITGPQSRAYPGDRRQRGHSGMDTVLHFVLGTPEPAGGCLIWLGIPIGPEEILPEARHLPLPRTTRATTHGFTRCNYLGQDFALGSISGHGRFVGHEAPFFLAHRTASDRCGIPFMPAAPPDAHYAIQQEGSLLAGCVWQVDRQRKTQTEPAIEGLGLLSGLRTGRPETLISDPAFLPGFTVELGLRSQFRLFQADGSELGSGSQPGPLPVLAGETESIIFGLRFFGSGATVPELRLTEDENGELSLVVRSPAEGVPVNSRELAVCCGFLLQVIPRAPGLSGAAAARQMAEARLDLQPNPDGWQAFARTADQPELWLELPAAPPCMYSWNGNAVSANQWAISLRPA